MGLKVRLGHEDGSKCPHTGADQKPLVVIHNNAIRPVAVRYCNCLGTSNVPRRQQLLCCGWYPASVIALETCASFAALKLFHAGTLTGKVSAYNFYRSLVYMTDVLGFKVPKVNTHHSLES